MREFKTANTILVAPAFQFSLRTMLLLTAGVNYLVTAHGAEQLSQHLISLS